MSVFGSRRRIIELIEIRYRLKHREKNIQIKRDTHSEEIQVGKKNEEFWTQLQKSKTSISNLSFQYL
jgi:hypothetical protein